LDERVLEVEVNIQHMKEKRKGFSKSVYFEQMKRMGEDKHFCAENFLDILSEDNGPIQIVDNEGNLLAYRFKVSTECVAALETGDDFLVKRKPTGELAKGKRGDHSAKHYGIWCDYSAEVMETSEWIKFQETTGKKWLETVEPALNELVQVARHLVPEAYGKVRRVDPGVNRTHQKGLNTQSEFTPITKMWWTLAVNHQQIDGGEIHQDWMDCDTVPNGVIPYGKTFVKGFLVLYQLGIRLELKRGDAVIFYGSTIAHNVVDIEGERNSIDCFMHKSNFDWWKRQTESGQIQRKKSEPLVGVNTNKENKVARKQEKGSLKRKSDNELKRMGLMVSESLVMKKHVKDVNILDRMERR
jgi:hypothetical protein